MFYRYDEDIRGGIETIEATVKDILNHTKLILNDEDLNFDLRLILNELLINAFVHGNRKDINKCMHLCLVIDDRTLRINIEDEGTGLCEPHDYDCKQLKNHGRGLVLVKSLTDRFQMKDNRVKCTINIRCKDL